MSKRHACVLLPLGQASRQRAGGAQKPDFRAVPVREAGRDEAHEARASLLVETAEALDERGDRHLRGAPCPIVGLDRKTEPGFRQCSAEYTLRPRLGEDAWPKQAHNFRVEAASSGDGQGMRSDGGANARCSLAAFWR